MADFKKGDRVLVEATVDCTAYDGHLVFLDLPLDHPEPRHTRGTESVLKARQAVSAVHAHPGDWEIKHIPDLVRECELATRENEMLHAGNGTIEATPLRVELHALRNAREATNKPQLSMGRLEKLIEPALEARIGDRVFLYLKGSDSALGGHLTRPVNWMGNVLAIYTEGIAAPEEESRALVEQIAAVFVLRMEDD